MAGSPRITPLPSVSLSLHICEMGVLRAVMLQAKHASSPPRGSELETAQTPWRPHSRGERGNPHQPRVRPGS